MSYSGGGLAQVGDKAQRWGWVGGGVQKCEDTMLFHTYRLVPSDNVFKASKA